MRSHGPPSPNCEGMLRKLHLVFTASVLGGAQEGGGCQPQLRLCESVGTVGCNLGLARSAHGGRHISETQVSFSPAAQPWPWIQGAQPAARTAPQSGPCLVLMLWLQALPRRINGIHSQAALALPASCGLSRVLAKPPPPGPGLFPGVRCSVCRVWAPACIQVLWP